MMLHITAGLSEAFSVQDLSGFIFAWRKKRGMSHMRKNVKQNSMSGRTECSTTLHC